MPTQEIRNFWDKTREQLAEVEMDPRVELVEDADPFTQEGRIKSRNIYRVAMTSFGGKRIRAWYATPSGPAASSRMAGDYGSSRICRRYAPAGPPAPIRLRHIVPVSP